jgi:AcrR family transcriptional regulator
MSASRRDQLVETALRLFCRNGFHATGIDRILADSGVAKMTLYNHFKSKDELIVAALRLRDERDRQALTREVERRGGGPVERLLAVFDVLNDRLQGKAFSGCAFINASAEFGDPRHPVHAACAEHKRLMRGYLRQLAEAAQLPEPGVLADQLGLLLEGAIVSAQVIGDRDAARKARRAAESLVGAARGAAAS